MQVLDQKVTNARNASHNPKHVSNGLKKIQVIHPKMTIINQKKKIMSSTKSCKSSTKKNLCNLSKQSNLRKIRHFVRSIIYKGILINLMRIITIFKFQPTFLFYFEQFI